MQHAFAEKSIKCDFHWLQAVCTDSLSLGGSSLFRKKVIEVVCIHCICQRTKADKGSNVEVCMLRFIRWQSHV